MNSHFRENDRRESGFIRGEFLIPQYYIISSYRQFFVNKQTIFLRDSPQQSHHYKEESRLYTLALQHIRQ